MRLIHLSDIHYSKDSAYEFINFLIPALLKDLEFVNSNKKIDMIVVSGDLVDKAGTSLGGSYNALKKVEEVILNPIIQNLKLRKENFLICPGNHEIERGKDDTIIENGIIGTLLDTNSTNTFIEKNKINKTGKLERIVGYKNFEREFYSDLECPHRLTNFEFCLISQIDGIRVGVSSLNSTWRSYSDYDKG